MEGAGRRADENGRDHDQRDDAPPQVREGRATDDDPARDRDEVRRRQDLRDEPERSRQRREREEVRSRVEKMLRQIDAMGAEEAAAG